MASSTLSLDSLSSPSPSPSPPPQPDLPHSTSASAHPAAAATAQPFRTFDNDSDLSDLTDDDQDVSIALEKSNASIATSSSSKDPAAMDDDDDLAPADSSSAHAGPSSRPTRRGRARRSSSARGGGVGRKKGSSIVPVSMWGWVPKQPPASSAVVEEEEEEITEPPRAMEEEEEEEEDEEEEEEEEEEYEGYDHDEDSGGEEGGPLRHPAVAQRRQDTAKRPVPTPNSTKPRAGGKVAPVPSRRHAPTSRSHPIPSDNEEDYESEEDTKSEKRPRPPSGKRVQSKGGDNDKQLHADNDDHEDAVSISSFKKKRPVRSRAPPSASRKRKGSESGSDVQVAAKKKKNGTKVHDDDDGTLNAMDASSGQDNTESETELVKPPSVPLSPSKTTTNGKPLSSVAASSINSAATALSALAAIAEEAKPNEIAASTPVITSSLPHILAPPLPASRSRSNSLDAGSEAELSADDSKTKTKGRGQQRATAKAAPAKPKTRGKGSPTEKKDLTSILNGISGDPVKSPTISTNPTKKGPPPPLDLKIDTSVPNSLIVAADDHDMDVDGEDEANDRSMEDIAEVDMEPTSREPEEEEEEEEDEGEDEDPPEEEDQDPADEEPVEPDPDAEEDALEADDDPADNDGEDDVDQEQDNEQDAAEAEQENDDGENEENEEAPSPGGDADADVEDHESDLQPAHRAEALDVLATIELKFALLRERVYVEKMEGLAWEEMMIQNSAHPEMLHLQKELSKRRDKRLELASRKRSYEVANSTTRRKADESGLWSWWKAARDSLQTDMIAETSRKRRKIERERRAVERPQPIRRIPRPADIHHPPLPPPSLRKIIKSYPFGSRKQNKSDTSHHSHSLYPKNLVYPEISTLSATDIQNDLEFLFQHRQPTNYDLQHRLQHTQQQHYAQHPPLQRNSSGMGMASGMGLGRTPSVGLQQQNGALPPPPPLPQSSMGPPPSGSMGHQHPSQHGMGYDSYGDIPPYGSGGPPPGRMRDPYQSQPSNGSLPLGPPPGNSKDIMGSFSNFAGPGGRGQPINAGHHSHGYPGDHEMSAMGPGPNSSGMGHGPPHHAHFGQNNVGLGNNGAHAPPSSSSHMSGHHGGSMKGSNNMGMNGRRSISPVPVHAMPNGNSSSKANGSWMGLGMGMGNYMGNGNGTGAAEWDARLLHEEDERDRMMRDRERKRERDEREREKEMRDRDIMRREREYDIERERREQQHMQQLSQHRPPPPPGSGSSHPSLSHMHDRSANGPPSTQGPGVPHHLHQHHHHHRTHHHHIVHNHHGPQHASSSLPPPVVGGGAPPIVHSPRSTRDYESSRPPQGPMHSGPVQPHPTEMIMLSSGKGSQSTMGPREREPWPMKSVDDQHHHPSLVDYRDRERDGMNRERNESRDSRKSHSGRHSVGPPMTPLDDRADRPMAMPFVMASSHAMQSAAGMSSSSHSTSSPRGGPSWNTSMEEAPYRASSSSAPPPGGFLTHDVRNRSPIQGHRYASNPSSHAPPLTRIPTSSSSSLHHRLASPPIPSGRARPPQSPSYATSMHHSPVTSPKLRPLSPAPIGKHLLIGPSSGPGYSSSPHLSGPGRTSTPTDRLMPPSSSGPPQSMQVDAIMKNGTPYNNISSRTASPLMSSLQGSGRSTVNGMGGSGSSVDRDRIDRDREQRHASSPRLGASSVPIPPLPSKLSTAQTVDGH